MQVFYAGRIDYGMKDQLILTPEDAYWAGPRFESPSMTRVEQLGQAADSWLATGYPFAAGIALIDATRAGWGLLDRKTRVGYIGRAIAAFRSCVEGSPADSMEALLALRQWYQELRSLDYADERQLARDTNAVYLTLADRLVRGFSDHHNAASFLVYGLRLQGPITGPWTPEFPGGVVSSETTTWDSHVRTFCFRVPSAFELFLRMGDYRAAHEISGRCSWAFKSPDLRGWQMAVQAFTATQCAAESFAGAATIFEDTGPETYRDADGAWSGVNRHLWAPYFRSRSWIARAVTDPERAEEYISQAAACMPDHRSYAHTAVHRYHLLIRMLAGALGLDHGIGAADARAVFESDIRFFGENDGDPATLEFLDHAYAGFEQMRADRRQGLSSVGRAMLALDRIPLIRQVEAETVRKAIDRRAIGILEGPNRLWMHRALEGITDERDFRRLLLRLFQNSVPRYAQIRHGPIEYGKDIAVAAEHNGRLVLRMYQAKCGNIKKAGWRQIRLQLEEMFQVPLDPFQIHDPVEERVAILIWNGHADPHVEPLMAAWKSEQRSAFGRDYEFMHLDDMVNYILENRLITAFRDAIAEINAARA
ncbi:MAG TPA: hypothetical protein VNH11_04140 [Pirellulales bacterium]|nr:hypothetical protein [Pirellulales bacterium]